MIEVSGLCKSYSGNRAIENITFSIPEGQVVGFLGPNGAGKTTTMNIITGYLSADAGSVKIAGIGVLEDPIEARRHIGYLPEQPPLYPSMTVDEYLAFAYDLKGLKSPNRQKHIAKICEMTGIDDVRKRVVGHLSKGYRQRIGLAQAMLGEPDVLILDEPTIGLDPRQIVEIRKVIEGIGKKRTVILSTHILTEAAAVCQRILVISSGRIVADDKAGNLAGSGVISKSLILRAAGSKTELQSIIREIEGIKSIKSLGEAEPGSYDFQIATKPNADIRKSLFAALAQAGKPILMLRPENSSLEEVFLKLTGKDEDGGRSGMTGRKRPKKKAEVEAPEEESYYDPDDNGQEAQIQAPGDREEDD